MVFKLAIARHTVGELVLDHHVLFIVLFPFWDRLEIKVVVRRVSLYLGVDEHRL